ARRRGHHRREPADADQAGAAAAGDGPAGAGPRDARARPQRDLGGVRAPEGSEDMTACAVTITNPLGMHARAAARFVHTASAFQSRVRVTRGTQEMDGKSIMGLLLLTAAEGTSVTISADGVDK